MKTSEQINELAAALAKAQGEMKNPPLDGTNPHFRSRYASLAAVRDAVLPVMAKHGISVTQELTSTTNPPAVGCMTVLLHSSGQWVEVGPFWIPVAKADAQGFVAAGTYAKRVSMQSVACVVGDDDDDGEAVVGRGPQSAEKPQKAPAKVPAAPANADFPPTSGPIGTPQKAAQAAPDCWTKDDDVALARVAKKLGPEMTKEKAGSFGFKKEKGLIANYGLDGNDLALMRAWMAAEVAT